MVQENFVPPKTWKRTLPSSGRWSFKLALESRRTDPLSTPSSRGETSGGSGGTTKDIGGNDGGEVATTQQESQQGSPSGGDDQGVPAAEEGETQRQRGSTYDTASSVPNIDAAVENPSPLLETPAAVDASAKERTIDNWPGRTVCREVCKDFLSWELEDGDFCVKQEGDEMVDDGFEDTKEQREEAAAVRAALIRRQAKLEEVLRDVQTNEEAGMVGVGS